jgi:hypothetical protein
MRDFQPGVAGRDRCWTILNQVASWEWGEAEVAMSSRRRQTDWMLACLRGDIAHTTRGGELCIVGPSPGL